MTALQSLHLESIAIAASLRQLDALAWVAYLTNPTSELNAAYWAASDAYEAARQVRDELGRRLEAEKAAA